MDSETGITVVVGLLAVGLVVGGAAAFGGLDLGGTDSVATDRPGTDQVGTDHEKTDTGETDRPETDSSDGDSSGAANVSGLDTFDSSAAFARYVHQSGVAPRGGGAAGGAARGGTPTPQATATESAGSDGGDGSRQAEPGEADAGGADGDDQRVAETNVQVDAVDEPDIVKADGHQFYYAAAARDRYHDHHDDPRTDRTFVIDASEPANPRQIGRINASGRQLLVNDTLVVLRDEELVGYDVSDPADPTHAWTRERNGSVVTARATGGQVYLVVRMGVREASDCPVEPMAGAAVDCGDIYHPEDRVPVDGTYVVLSVDPASGNVTDSVGFVGTQRNTAVYMDADSLYVSYTDPLDRGEVHTDALLASDEVPAHVKDRLREIRGYDLSRRAHFYEVHSTVETWLDTLKPDERDRTVENLSRDVEAHLANNSRTFTTTGIVRVDVGDGLSVAAHGTVPGRPLNQFSLDEHNGTLRVATTIPGAGDSDSENDLYALDASTLDRIGEIQGMGKDQEIFAVRYVGDTAYLVTFRRVDPFHVVDLSDPSDPVEEGVLELPGFSSYLHPVDEDHVLGIGEEDGHVKAVLFDVSDPTDPTIADSNVFDRHWSRVSESHHAFLIDRRHEVFFMPAGDDGLVVDYANESLAVETTVDVEGAARARYVGDYLYVFGRENVVVVDEQSWNRTATLPLD